MARKRIVVLGASGGIGRPIVERLLAAGHEVVCQTRSAQRLSHLSGRGVIAVVDPRDRSGLARLLTGADAVIFALGVDRTGPTTLFSDVTAGLLDAMRQAGVRRLIAVTGVGAGDTRGHGGFLYDRIVFPLFTRRRYEDKDRQETLIAASDLDWVIVRPAPFARTAPGGPIEVHTRIEPGTRLRRITREEVADFVVTQIDDDRYLRQRPFIGHP